MLLFLFVFETSSLLLLRRAFNICLAIFNLKEYNICGKTLLCAVHMLVVNIQLFPVNLFHNLFDILFCGCLVICNLTRFLIEYLTSVLKYIHISLF